MSRAGKEIGALRRPGLDAVVLSFSRAISLRRVVVAEAVSVAMKVLRERLSLRLDVAHVQ